MNPYKAAAIAVAALVGVSGGAFAAINLGDSETADPPIGLPSESPQESQTPPSSSPTPERSDATSEPTTDTGGGSTSEETPDSGGGAGEADPSDEPETENPDEGGSDYLSVTMDGASLLGSEDPSGQPLFVSVTVCVDSVPSGDADGLVDIRSSNFWLDQTGNDPHEGPAMSESERDGIGGDDMFPDLVSLGEGECTSGDVVFMSGTDVDSTTMTFSNDYSDTLTFDIVAD